MLSTRVWRAQSRNLARKRARYVREESAAKKRLERSQEHSTRQQTDGEMLPTRVAWQVVARVEGALTHRNERALRAASVAERQHEHACVLVQWLQSEEVADSTERHEEVIAKSTFSGNGAGSRVAGGMVTAC